MEFNFTIRQDAEKVLDRVCMLAQDKVIVSGDPHRGRFSGMFDGSYKVNGKDVSLVIKRKPMFVSWSLVQKGLDYLTV